MNNLPLEIINYIWLFDDRKYNNYKLCVNELNKLFNEFTHKMNLTKNYRSNRYGWFKREYLNYGFKFYLKRIKQINKFNYLIENEI